MTIEFFTQQLWRAAQERKVCKVKMNAETFVRTIHPYGICQSSRNKIVLVCWQVSGVSQSGSIPGYRNLILQNCEGVEILETTFEKQKDFNPEDRIYKDWVFHI